MHTHMCQKSSAQWAANFQAKALHSMNKLGLSPASCRHWWEEPRPGEGMWIICLAGGKQLSGLSWGNWKQTWPQQEFRQGITGAREEGRPGYTTILVLQLMSRVANPQDLSWSPAGGRGNNLLGQGLQSWSLKSFVSEGFWQQHSKSYLLNFPRWMLSLSSMGLLCLFPSSHWSGNN